MLKNFWQAIEFSDRVSTTPARVTCLGQELVLYRTESGQAVVLNDLCVHRGAALSGGWVAGNCIVCPYHGWEYEPDGSCTKIPAHPTNRIPRKARSDSYPVVERYGFVWTYLGDLPEAERPPLPEWPEFEDPRYRPVTGEFLWNANYERVLENGCDIAHAPFVHGGSFGNRDKPEVPDHDIVEGEWSASVTVELEPTPPKGLWSLLAKRDKGPRPKVVTTTGFFMPNILQLKIRLPIGELCIYDINIPVDETTTLTKWVALRTFFPKAWADKNAIKRVHKIFLQDQEVVEAVRPELLPFDLQAELHVRSDAMSLAYRRMRDKCLAMGWGVDAHRIDGGTREATVIPSPARRENPELANAWVLKEKAGELK